MPKPETDLSQVAQNPEEIQRLRRGGGYFLIGALNSTLGSVINADNPNTAARAILFTSGILFALIGAHQIARSSERLGIDHLDVKDKLKIMFRRTPRQERTPTQ